MRRAAMLVGVLWVAASCPGAELRLHPVFDSNMVVQRDKAVQVWGWAEAGEAVTVEFAGQKKSATAAADGAWAIGLDPLEASAEPRALVVKGKANTVTCENVLVGDVWVCGGQSNMEDELEGVYHGDVEVASANHPAIRLLTVPVNAGPKPLSEFPRLNEYNAWTKRYEQKGSWFVCSPETVNRFSAIGYIFGRRLHLASRVPIGLIDASRGGTTVETWTSREALAKLPEAGPLLKHWDDRVAAYDPQQDLQDRIQRWQKDSETRKEKGQAPNPKPEDVRPGPIADHNNPGSSYNGMIAPLAGFAVKGAIFNQGFNNALGDARPELYAKCLPAMIGVWRETFLDEQMPFGIVELTAGGQPQTLDNFELMMLDAGPFIREAQFKASRGQPNVGFACAYDEQVPWYHPHKKVLLGERIARWALATQYGARLGYEPAVCIAAEPKGDRMILTFDRLVQTHDGRPIEGFAVAGADRRFCPAHAQYPVIGKDDRGREQVDRKRLEVWSPLVSDPVAVRYAWARNPLGNLVNSQHHERILPVPSFRTDDWAWGDAPFDPEASNKAKQQRGEIRKEAEKQMRQRKLEEARLLVQQLEAEATGKK